MGEDDSAPDWKTLLSSQPDSGSSVKGRETRLACVPASATWHGGQTNKSIDRALSRRTVFLGLPTLRTTGSSSGSLSSTNVGCAGLTAFLLEGPPREGSADARRRLG